MKRRWLFALALSCLLPSGSGFSQDAYRDGQNAVRDVFPQGGQELMDASAIQSLPSYSDTPAERSYFNNPSAMDSAGQSALGGTGAAGTAYTRAISPNYLDPAATRTLLAAGIAVEADPLAVVGADVGLSGQYGACTDSAVYDTTTGRYGCEVSGTSRNEDQTCDYTGRPRTITTWIYAVGTPADLTQFSNEPNCTQLGEMQLPGIGNSGIWEFQCSGQVATTAPFYTTSQQNGYDLNPSTCASFYARGECTGHSEVCVAGPAVSGYGVADGVVDFASYIDYHPDLLAAFTTGSYTPCNGTTKAQCGAIHWNAHGRGEGRYLPRGGECWRMRVTASCEVMTGQVLNTCALPDPACQLVQNTCLSTASDGTCISEHHEYSCPAQQIQTGTVSVCSQNVYCITGDCFPAIEPEPSDQFAKASAAFAAVFEGASQLDENSLTIFDGENLKCGKAIFGAFNCCKDEGILNDIGLNQCNADEQRLAQSQGLHECTYVGTYCSDKTFFGVCLKKQRSYCCHGSRLSRIITEQGRAQLGRSYGDAKNPDCSGFTVAEFASLDIGAMDLSEFYADLENSLTIPDPATASAVIQRRLPNHGN
ncbi:MAG: conjugal transfer protein TraN [Pseudomonadota bacterium]